MEQLIKSYYTSPEFIVKTHIIPIESHDDAYSVRDKMAWGKSARILLVWPDRGGGVLDRRIDLLLLKRRAEQLGSQLAAVTRDPEVREHAGDLAIPVFHSTSQAQASRWLRHSSDAPELEEIEPVSRDLRGARPDRANGGPPSGPLARLGALGAAVAAVLALTAALLPSAVIRLEPQAREQAVEFTAVTGPSVGAPSASGSVPTTALSVVVEGRYATETTGSVFVPSGTAAGEVAFTNLTTEEVVVPQGAVVLTGGSDPVRFLVTEAGALPAGPGTVLTMTVTAVMPGSASNVPEGAVIAVEGLLGLQVTAANPAPLTGGTDVRLTAPTELDRNRASRELLESLRLAAAEELAALVEPDDVVLSPEPFLVATEQESYLPEENVPSDIVEVTLRVEFRILVIPFRELEALARAVLDAGLESDFVPADAEVEIEFLTQPEPAADGSASWEMAVARAIRSVPDPDPLIFEILGKSPEEAAGLLAAAFDLGAAPEITISPAWWPRLPLLPVQILVTIG